jgi:DNA-binding response OmpR family regulator
MVKILFIESDLELAHIYQKKFIASGFEFEIASSKDEALQKIAHSKFDAILLEIAFQEMVGMDILREIRTNHHVYAADLKVIIFSDSTDRELHRQAASLGVNGFIVKIDYAPSRLVDEVNRFLHQFEEQAKNEALFRNGGIPIPKHKRILLVENEEVFVDMFGKRLRDEGYDVDIARNGTEGFEKASTETYALMITDMVMAGLNGKELIAKLKEDGRTKDLPVFLFSASVDETELEEMRRQGAKCFMKTHITPSELVQEVNYFLG